MKTLPAQGPMNNINSPSRSIAVLAVILFALSGLISGFAVGGFLHSKSGQSSTAGAGTSSEGQTTKSSSSSPTSHPTLLGYPQNNLSSADERANGTTYTLTTQAVNKDNQPVHASDITCKLWLVQRIPDHTTLNISTSTLKDVNAIQNPIIGTVNERPFEDLNGLNFDSSTPQTHFCNANGQFTWKYQLSSSVEPGDYDLVVLTDWSGVHYNWSWVNINIR